MTAIRDSEVKQAVISFTHGGATATQIVAAVAEYKIKVIGLVLTVSADVSVTIEDTDGTDITGPMPLAANGGFVLPPTEAGWCWTAVSKGFSVRTSAAASGGGVLLYKETP